MGDCGPCVDEKLVARGHFANERNLYRLGLALLVYAEGQSPGGIDLAHPQREGHIATGDATLLPYAAGAGVAGVLPLRLWGEGHSITLALSSSSSCS